MKKNSYLIPLLGTAMLLAIAGCSDDEMIQQGNNNRPQGKGIVFGASASYVGNANSRTAYGDYAADGKSQEIIWESDDRVEIYSPESPTKQQVEYQIANIQVDEGDAYLAAYNNQDGLQWSSDKETQNFYAVYPSKASMVNQEMANRYVSFKNGVLKGFIPTNQQNTISKSTGRWVATPNMDWQYMVAHTTGFTVPAEGEGDGGVSLAFKPLVTTLEITLVGPSSPLAQMNIEAPEGTTIMGRFSCDLTNWDNADEAPACVADQTGTTTNYVTINLYDDKNQPLKLEENEQITFNVFLLPVKNLTDLKVRIAGFNTASRTMALNEGASETEAGTPITLTPHKKTRVTIKAPQIGEETNQWMGGLNDNVLVSQLSIPGTANSFSYNYTGESYEKWKTQSANIDNQWDAGIRCFELVCGENGGNVEESPLLCNRHVINGMTFGQAVENIWQKVQDNPSEFAIIIPSYDSGTGHPADHNGVDKFAKGLNTFYDDHTEYSYETFTRELTVGEARGHLIFIARITSEEDRGYNLPAPHQGTFVDEWGSLKDNWERRGYAVNGTRVNNWATSASDNNSVEYYMHTRTTRNYGTNNNGNITAPEPDRFNLVGKPTLETDFVHTGQRSGGGEGRAYIQDWQRVVPREGTYSGSELRPGSFYLGYEAGGWFGDDYYHYYYWPESLTEKETNIWDTFMASIEGNSQEGGGDMFYINSLDGFFVDPSIEKSYRPYVSSGTWGVGLSDGGTEGNILAYANYINDWFYNRILRYGVTNIYGPLNIILMDYVYDGTDGGDRLPSTIINNNFRFPLLTGDGGSTTLPSNADASYSNGGNVIK